MTAKPGPPEVGHPSTKPRTRLEGDQQADLSRFNPSGRGQPKGPWDRGATTKSGAGCDRKIVAKRTVTRNPSGLQTNLSDPKNWDGGVVKPDPKPKHPFFDEPSLTLQREFGKMLISDEGNQTMESWMVIPVMLLVYGLIEWARRSNTEVGRRIRDTDQDAYDMAVQDRQRDLEELRDYGRKHGLDV